MSKVVYLLGAGASYGIRERGTGSPIVSGLPIVCEIENEFANVIKQLNDISLGDRDLEERKARLIKDFQDLKETCAVNATIDTYAKKLCLQRKKEEFSRVELLLTIFFILEQIIHKPDKRYETFLANVLTDDLSLPNEIRIISWNYDNQLELAYQEFSDGNYAQIRDSLGVFDVKGDEGNVYASNRNKIFKLNGTANFTKEEDWLKQSYNCRLEPALLRRILERYSDLLGSTSDGITRLNFAWRNRWSDNILSQIIPTQIEDAITLVVIGYTFPYFNRKVDRILFENMPNLKNIYIQDLYPKRIEQYIKPAIPQHQLNSIAIHILDDVEQFYLPPEL